MGKARDHMVYIQMEKGLNLETTHGVTTAIRYFESTNENPDLKGLP